MSYHYNTIDELYEGLIDYLNLVVYFDNFDKTMVFINIIKKRNNKLSLLLVQSNEQYIKLKDEFCDGVKFENQLVTEFRASTLIVRTTT